MNWGSNTYMNLLSQQHPNQRVIEIVFSPRGPSKKSSQFIPVNRIRSETSRRDGSTHPPSMYDERDDHSQYFVPNELFYLSMSNFKTRERGMHQGRRCKRRKSIPHSRFGLRLLRKSRDSDQGFFLINHRIGL
jgi:hypothetical protein